MAHIITGLFTHSKDAGDAIAELKNKGYTKDISLVTKDISKSEGVSAHTVKENVTDGTVGGAAVGAAMGALAALLVGATSFVIPGLGLLVAGPLAVGLSGAAAGALTGGVVGALVDKGIPDDKAKMYQGRVEQGDVLVAVLVGSDHQAEVSQILEQHNATEISMGNKDVS